MGKRSCNILSDTSLADMLATQESPLVRNLLSLGLEHPTNAHPQRSWDTLILSMLSQVPGYRFRSPS
jgi:hypothetical protein